MARNLLFPLPDDIDFTKPEAVEILNDRFRRISSSFGAVVKQQTTVVVSGGSSGGVAGSITFLTITLTADSGSVALPAVVAGSFLAIVIYEDATGGWVQTWQAALVGMAGFVQSTTPLSYTSAFFYTPDGTTFLLLGAPVTGVL